MKSLCKYKIANFLGWSTINLALILIAYTRSREVYAGTVQLRLNDALTKAWELSDDLRIADAEISLQRSMNEEKNPRTLPQLEVNLSDSIAANQYSDAALNQAAGHDEQKLQHSAAFDLSYSLTNLYKKEKIESSLQKEVAAKALMKKMKRRQFIFELANFYIEVLASKLNLNLADSLQHVNQIRFKVASDLSKGGLLAVNDLARIELAYYTSQNEREVVYQDVLSKELQLKNMLNLKEEDEIIFTDLPNFSEKLLSSNPRQKSAQNLKKIDSSDEISYQHTLSEIMSQRLDENLLRTYPDLSLFSDYTLLANPYPDEARTQYAVGIALKWQTDAYFSYRRSKATLLADLAKHEVEKKMTHERLTKSAAIYSLELDQFKNLMEKYQQSAIIAKKSFNLEEELFKKGHARVDNVLNAQVAYIQIEKNIILTTKNYLQSLINLQMTQNLDLPNIKGL